MKREKNFEENINDLFRIMHTIKSTSAMMGYDLLSAFAHRLEDLFSALRSAAAREAGLGGRVFDLLFGSLEAMREELKRQPGSEEGAEAFESLTLQMAVVLDEMKNGVAAAPAQSPATEGGEASVRIFLEPGCAMANVRAYIICTQLRRYAPG
ncbi:MAG: Hpt domain-containing protein [Cloacibacillus evryensis]